MSYREAFIRFHVHDQEVKNREAILLATQHNFIQASLMAASMGKHKMELLQPNRFNPYEES